MKISNARAKNRRGFTWMELLAIVGMIGLIGAAAGAIYHEHLVNCERAKAWNEAKTQEGIPEINRIQKDRVAAEKPRRFGVVPFSVLLPFPFL
jgi:Tfp pilus assembly protein PilE